MNARQALERTRAPSELAAEQRAWEVVRSAYREREAATPRRSISRPGLAILAAVVAGAIALSPAGATVGRLISHALGVRNAAPRLSSLPASGRLLVSSPAATWTVAPDGSMRRLGFWPEASWSPHGRYLAATGGNELAAVDPHGIVQWALRRSAVIDARWYSPSGYRLAYLSAGDLRVVAGDGTGDHLLAQGVADVAPAWRPGHPYELAYVTGGGTLKVRDGDSGRLLWSRTLGSGINRLGWSADGRYLLAASGTGTWIYTGRGELIWRERAPSGGPVLDAALSPNGRTVALTLGGNTPEVIIAAARAAPRRVLAGVGLRQVLWSPDGHWLLITWPAAIQLVFVRVVGPPSIAAVSHIAQQFAGSGQTAVFPRLEGWCCTTRG